jgi:RNA polymerase sigma-70 factor (ECF subfamily)
VPDETDFQDLFRASYRRLVAQLFLVTTDKSEAEDMVQEAFTRLWMGWDKLHGYDNLEAWVRRVAMNAAISHWRRHSRSTQLDAAAYGVDSEQSMIDLILVLKELPTRYRQALVLYEVVGLSVEEVATEMSTKVGTVKSLLSRGRTALAQLWRNEGAAT